MTPERNKYENELKPRVCPNCFCGGTFMEVEPRRWVDDNFKLVDENTTKFVVTCGLCKWTGDTPPIKHKVGQNKFDWKIFILGVIQVGTLEDGTNTPYFDEIISRMEKSLADLEVRGQEP